MKAPQLRKFPYPYRAALSICSDIDGTDSYRKFKKIQSFMTDEIGIKFTNTFFPYLDNNQFSLFSGREEDRNIIIEHIKNGMIDAIHSYGDKGDFNRQDALNVLEELKRHNCKLKIWIDHAQSKSNLCKYRFFGMGDLKGTEEYHFDLTKDFGIQFIWTERLTNIIGQGVPFSLRSLLDIYDEGHPVYSLVNIAKTIGKIVFDVCGYDKYNYFKNNELIKIAHLRDGQKIYEFIRFNNYYRGPGRGDSFKELYYLISERVLDRLKKAEGYAIVYVHLGKNFDLHSREGKKTVAALRNLKQEFEIGNIYVDSTSKILDYYLTNKFLNWSLESNDGNIIRIKTVEDPINESYVPTQEQLENITFYVPGEVKIFVGNKEIKNIKHNPSDHTGKKSITILK